jgi:DNA sulfur modification protein DndB
MGHFEKLTLPSVRAFMGDWVYYVTTMSLADVAACVKPVDKIKERQELKTWLQRKLTEKRKKEIAEYLLRQEQRFFNAIVVGIYAGEPDWYPIAVGDNPTLGSITLDEHSKNSMGLLSLSGEEEIFAIDGQHRVEGIREALKSGPKLAEDEQCIIFVAHKTDAAGHVRTRRLFSTLNRYARLVSKGEIIALSEDDAFALVTRKLNEEYKYLKGDLAAFTKTPNVPPNDRKCITTMLALYDLIRILSCPKTLAGSRQRKRLELGPSQGETVLEIYNGHCEFWSALRKHISVIRKVTDSDPKDEMAGNFRRDDGGHVLFRPVGQKAFSNAVRVMMDRGVSLDNAVRSLSKTELDLNSPPWLGVLWNPVGKKIVWGNDTLAQNLFLYMVRQELPPKSKTVPYDLVEAYRKALNDPSATLNGVLKATPRRH